MTRSLQALSSVFALLAIPGCTEVLVSDGPDFGIVAIFLPSSPNDPVQAKGKFWRGVPSPSAPTIGGEEIDREGPCVLYRHDPPPMSSAPVPVHQPQFIDAGELRVTGGLTDVVMSFEEGKEYASQATGPIFEAGDTLTLHVEGSDEVAPMSVTVPVPPMPVVAPPPATIDIGEDLTFNWTSAPGTGRFSIGVATYQAGAPMGSTAVHHARDSVTCTVEVSQGTLTMPASLLSQLTTNGSRPARVYAHLENDETGHADKSLVFLGVVGSVVTPSGEFYGFDAELK